MHLEQIGMSLEIQDREEHGPAPLFTPLLTELFGTLVEHPSVESLLKQHLLKHSAKQDTEIPNIFWEIKNSDV